MTVPKLGSLYLIAGLLAAAPYASAQNPTASEAQQMLQANPALLEQLRQRILTSGLTPDQVRARLRAEGYPDTLLDAYLPGASANADASAPDEQVYSAITRLGIADTAEVDLLRCGITPDSLQVPDTLVSGIIDTTVTAARRSDRRVQLRARCLAQEDSIIRGLKHGANVDSGFVIFGLDFFRNRSTAFNPNLTGPVDANYKINPGDQLALILTGDVEQTYSLPVTREGFVVIP